MFSYGSAAASMKTLWQCGLLPMLMPHHAAYLAAHNFPRDPREMDGQKNLLIDMLKELDKHATPQKPVSASEFIAVLAAPLVAREVATVRHRLANNKKTAYERSEGLA